MRFALRMGLLLGVVVAFAVGVFADEKKSSPVPIVQLKPRELKGHGDKNVMGVSFSPDGKLLASACEDGNVIVWDLATDKPRHQFKVGGRVYGVVFSSDGKSVFGAGSDGVIRCWDVASGETRREMKGHGGDIAHLALSPDGKTLASASYDKTARLWDAATGEQKAVLKGHEDRVTRVAFSPDGKTLATGGTTALDIKGFKAGHPDRVRLWSLPSGKLERVMEARGDRVLFSPDGRLLAVSSQLFVEVEVKGRETSFEGVSIALLFDLREELPIVSRRGRGSIQAFSPDGRYYITAGGPITHYDHNVLAGGDFREGAEGVLELTQWETGTRAEIARWSVSTRPADVASTSDGRTWAYSESQGAVHKFGMADVFQSIRTDAKRQPTLEQLWGELASTPTAAHGAVWGIAGRPSDAVRLLGERLSATTEKELTTLRGWVKQLESERFAERQEALNRLGEGGPEAEAIIHEALANNPPAGVRAQLRAALARVRDVHTGEGLGRVRAVAALEYVGTAEANALLRKLGKGATDAVLTREATASLRRLGAE